MTKITVSIVLFLACLNVHAQERVVKVDFETSAFKNTPLIPFNQPFILEGEVVREVEYVQVLILNENSEKPLYSYSWNRNSSNKSETFSLLIPGVLKSNTKYDFRVISFTLMSDLQKKNLTENIRSRISFFFQNNYHYDGKEVIIDNPSSVYRDLKTLIDEALKLQKSKNSISYSAPSRLVFDAIKAQSEFKFQKFLRKSGTIEQDSLVNILLDAKVTYMTDLVMSEITPFINSDLVQYYRSVTIPSVSTDKEQFSLPINAGMYAWNKSVNINDVTVQNTNFTPGVGFTIPLSGKSTLAAKSKLFDSFGYSMGVLINPIRDATATEFVTPGVNLPVYAGLGFRLFKVVRLNAGVLIVGEKGLQDFSNLNVVPTAGLALELNLWLGLKK